MIGPDAAGSLKISTQIDKIIHSRFPETVVALAPSILSANFASLEADLRQMMRAHCWWTHLDVMDGHFVPNITFGPPLVKSIRKISPKLYLDTHLMIENPMKFVVPFVEAGSDSITFHGEAVENMPRLISAIRKTGARVGVSIKPRTPLRIIEPILDRIDMVLVMTVEPGFGGQDFMPAMLNKVRQLARKRAENNWHYLIEVDGGINTKTAGIAVAAGSNVLVAGSAIFGGGLKQIRPNIEAMSLAALQPQF